MLDVPNDAVRKAQTHPIVMRPEEVPLGLQVGVKLDDVAGLGHAEGAARVEVVSTHAIRRAAHDVVVDYSWGCISAHVMAIH